MPDPLSKSVFFEQFSAAQIVSHFDLVPDILIFIKNRDGRYVAFNRFFGEYCGLRSEHEELGRTDYDFFPKSRADQYTKDDKMVMSTGRTLVNRVECAPAPEGSPRLVSTTKAPLHDRHGKIIGVIGFARPLEQMAEASLDAVRLAQVVKQMHLHPEAPHRSSELARSVGLSLSQFDRCFRATFGATARQYLVRVRVEAACRLLARSHKIVATIALECGFCDHSHMGRCFRQVMKMTPKAYRLVHGKGGKPSSNAVLPIKARSNPR